MKPSKNFYQWDINQKFTECDGRFVDFIINEKVVYRVDIVNGECIIPDEFLQKSGYHTVYECMSDYTIQNHMFPVHPREKPPGYVYTPTEKLTFEGLVQKVNDTVADIIHRADTGEFDGYTPVKGEDYFTEAEKNEMVQSVSSGAVGEFREVVNSATSDFNKNSSAKTNEYNTNAEKKLSTYNSNDAEKLKAYNDNHTEKMTAYDTNATDKLSTYNNNTEVKLEAYNQNHTAKVAEYNQNAETKTAEFDSNAAALQTEVDRLRGECDKLEAEKANIDGYYEEMTVGDAEQLVATQFVEDNKPYLFRSTGGSSDVGNRAYLDKIVGGTVVWNQQLKLDRVANHNGITASLNNDGGITINGTATSDAYILIDSRRSFKLDENHKYLYKGCPSGGSRMGYFLGDGWSSMGRDYGKGTVFTATSGTFQPNIIVAKGNTVSNLTFKPQLFDLTQMFGSTIADYIYSIEQSQAGAGVEWFKKLFPKDYYPYNTGELISVEGLQSHDSVGFNQWDEEWEVGVFDNNGEPYGAATNAIRSKTFCKCVPNTAYYCRSSKTGSEYYIQMFYYDANKNFISMAYGNNRTFTTPQNAHYFKICTQTSSYIYGGTYLNDICINLSDTSRNGEYEPYKKHSYPLDSSLTLRGIPKLDASNNLYYDGDEYESDGTVTRKYGVLTPTTATLEANSYYSNKLGVPCWNFNMPSDMKGYNSWVGKNAIADKIVVRKYAENVTNCIITDATTKQFVYASSTGVTTEQATDFIRSLTFVYELATPTTETAKPFQHIQIVDDFGTEEFVSTGIVPVGHNTRYSANLRDKLQHLPSLANADGTYLIQQSGKQMSLIHMPAVFPDAPTEDGTYTLKTVVTGGTPTLQWVAE